MFVLVIIVDVVKSKIIPYNTDKKSNMKSEKSSVSNICLTFLTNISIEARGLSNEYVLRSNYS